MPGFSFSSVSRSVGATALATSALIAVAAPAGAHHDPEELAATERAADALATSSSDGGLSIGFVVLATLALGVAFALGRGWRPARVGRRTIALIATASLVSVPLAASPAGAATILLPDLISDQPDPNGSVEVNTYTGSARLILRFDGYVTNVGDGPLEVSGNPQITDSSNDAAVHQRALDTDGDWNVVGTPLVQYETADSHNHFHLMEVGRYSLWNQAKTAEAAPGQKVGFCLYDIEHAESEDWSGSRPGRVYSGSVTQFCDSNNPNTTDLVMGTSKGWRDVYGAYLTFQWIDVSDTAPGIYYLANEADPHNRILESDETNNQIGFSEQSSTIPGYNALPVAGIDTLEDTSVDLSLASESFGSPGSRRFRIVTAPDHGTLSRATGATFSSASVTYTPDAGYFGPDSFEYVAVDNSSNYPLNPTRAAVSIDVGEIPSPSVEISGAPASLIAGTSASLTATVSNAPDAVTWSVDGVVGGNATVGTVSAAGLYIAPATVPAGGNATVRATLDSDPAIFDEVVIAIDPIPNNSPIIVQPDDQISIVGDDVNLAVGANDPDGDAFTFGATGLPTGATMHPTTGVISGVVTTPGTFGVTVTADDGRDPSSVNFDWVVDVRPLVIPGHVGVTEGDAGSTTVQVPVSLSSPVATVVTADWFVHDGVAPIGSVGSDIAFSSGQVTFLPGETLTYLEVEVLGDTVFEEPVLWGEWAIVRFADISSNATLDRSGLFGLSAVVIFDDD